MTTTQHVAKSRQERRQPEALPALMTKRQVSEYLQVSLRQVEILTAKNRICQPIYLGESSPRWNRDDLLASLAAGQQAANGEG